MGPVSARVRVGPTTAALSVSLVTKTAPPVPGRGLVNVPRATQQAASYTSTQGLAWKAVRQTSTQTLPMRGNARTVTRSVRAARTTPPLDVSAAKAEEAILTI